jgi:hypothetical protein
LAAAAQAGRFNDNFSLEHVEDVGKNMEKWLTKGMDTQSAMCILQDFNVVV